MGLVRPTADNPALIEAVQQLVEAYKPERIYLFGSAARGDAGPGSDYDFMVVVPDESPQEARDPVIGYRVLRDFEFPKDVVVFTRHQFDKQLHLKASFPSTIVREGKLLYGA